VGLEERIVGDLHAAFMDDPVLAWTIPDVRRRERCGATYFRIHARRSGLAGTSWHADGGAALWDPPGAWRLSARESLALVAGTLRATGPGGLVRGAAFEEVDRLHPREPHWYLAILGVRPALRGRGLGSALLEPGLARADAEGMPCYLESSNPRNVGLYERHGFEVTAEHHLPDGPLLTLMWRPAR
jgi:ribosomal protein S18 acetylase RimI-like enzyme